MSHPLDFPLYEIKAKGFAKWFPVGLGAALLAGGVTGIVATALKDQPTVAAVVGHGLFLLLTGFGLFMLRGGFLSRTAFYNDRIESFAFIRTRILRKADIAGRRLQPIASVADRWSPGLLNLVVLVAKPGAGRDLKISAVLEREDAVREWLAPLADLDATDLLAMDEDVKTNPAYGPSAEVRLKSFESVRALVKKLSAIGWAIVIWNFAAPIPYDLALLTLAFMPLTLLMTMRHAGGLIRYSEKSKYPNFEALFFMSALVMMLRGLLDWQLQFDAHDFWVYGAAVCGVVLVVTILMPPVRTKAKYLAGVTFGAMIYSLGLVNYLNGSFDWSEPQIFHTEIVGKSISTGKHTEYKFEVRPWGSRTKDNQVTVAREYYDQAEIGHPLCVYLYPGALGVEWFVPERCPE